MTCRSSSLARRPFGPRLETFGDISSKQSGRRYATDVRTQGDRAMLQQDHQEAQVQAITDSLRKAFVIRTRQTRSTEPCPP